jgi:hypothetical protein
VESAGHRTRRGRSSKSRNSIIRGVFKANCKNGRTLAARNSARAEFARPSPRQTEGSPIAFLLVFHRCSEDHGETRRERGKTGNGCSCYVNDAAQARGTPGGLRIANFAVLYSRATITLREMTRYWNEVRLRLGSWLARLRLTGLAVVATLPDCWKAVQRDQRLATFRARVGRLTIAVQRTKIIRQRTALLIGRCSRWATTAQFLVKRLSARLRILTNSQSLQRLRFRCRKNLRFPFAPPYRCRDCGKRVGFRSRPRTLMERYILKLTLMQPVRCAECSRRDYRLIFTPVSERSRQRDESRNPIHRDAA